MKALLIRLMIYCVSVPIIAGIALTIGTAREAANACSGCEDGDAIEGAFWAASAVLACVVVIVVVEVVADRRNRRAARALPTVDQASSPTRAEEP